MMIHLSRLMHVTLDALCCKVQFLLGKYVSCVCLSRLSERLVRNAGPKQLSDWSIWQIKLESLYVQGQLIALSDHSLCQNLIRLPERIALRASWISAWKVCLWWVRLGALYNRIVSVRRLCFVAVCLISIFVENRNWNKTSRPIRRALYYVPCDQQHPCQPC